MGVQFIEWGYNTIIKLYKLWKTIEKIKESRCKKAQEKAKGLEVKINKIKLKINLALGLNNRKAIHVGITLSNVDQRNFKRVSNFWS